MLAVPPFIYKALASGFGAGYSPIAPGTAGAVGACLLLYLLHQAAPGVFTSGQSFDALSLLNYGLLVGGFFIIGVVAANALQAEWGKDPSVIVIDEMVGTWMALFAVPFQWSYVLAGFALFRLFDIWKPLGIRQLERWPGGWGVMMDDVLAGVYANAVLHAILWYWAP